ncbi:GlsB/YeaQ/YmgE family stress response membrane protein [Micromonospora halophytica]|uniref:Transglycosylase associated protein n=1 Tax=Micromonospora halophytica TaxID=47864 RepID=A0A1C5HJ53_9ACTN|nr:GlsB/YeaQ/YmgE family stress response membrane protein [Micromonospora halophytica]SCG46018.1 hypothetical protein GA0070560_104281 [Micromonospora halophytica]
MTVTGIVSAVVVGLVVGSLGRLLIPGRQRIPVWLTAATGLVAALLGTIVARLAGIDADGFGPLQLVVQVGLAGLGVALVAGTAGGSRSER